MIIKCGCSSFLGNSAGAKYQDSKYGNGMRAHNPIVKEPKGSNWRCTICEKENSKTPENHGKRK